MKTLHFDCFAGISGDMTLGALVDLGVAPAALLEDLRKLGVKGWDLTFHKEERCGITGTRAVVTLDHHHEGGEEGKGGEHHRPERKSGRPSQKGGLQCSRTRAAGSGPH